MLDSLDAQRLCLVIDDLDRRLLRLPSKGGDEKRRNGSKLNGGNYLAFEGQVSLGQCRVVEKDNDLPLKQAPQLGSIQLEMNHTLSAGSNLMRHAGCEEGRGHAG